MADDKIVAGCPFCGKSAGDYHPADQGISISSDGAICETTFVRCDGCGACGPTVNYDDDRVDLSDDDDWVGAVAAREWNKRIVV